MASDEGAEGTIRRVLDALGNAGVPYMLTGSFASSFHGAPRTTQDVDIVIAPTSALAAVAHPRGIQPSSAMDAYRP